ncbi:hypothetical protein GLOIN_2v1882276 [Rhizophagus clarus]|uniref:Uncharacterized protein n=1 Tax=Rhizophagus clarus TaxID=94130 RepID=A0A8H3M059_9GLOM|nr:hypothetical protein GLOIN_2v1882276 [Rhizophagus clarus]
MLSLEIGSRKWNRDQLPMETHYEIPLVDKEMDTSLPEEPIPEVTAKQSVSAVNIPVMDQCDQTSLEDKETDAFLDEVHKKKVVKESAPKESSLVHMEPQKIEEKQVNLSEIKEAKIPYSQKVEQDLILKHILEVPIDAELTPGSVPHLAHLFDKAEKTGRKDKLRWYYYSEEYEKKVVALSSENNISDQMARTQIYDEMELYLPGKKREYLRKMTQKAKNIYTLFKGIGIDKIGVVTSSADATSRLTNAQIQNIINLYTDESQKLIGVNNCSHARDLPAELNKSGSKKSPDVRISTPPTTKTNQINVQAQSKPTYNRFYFQKGNMSKFDKILTPKYLDWHAKLTGLPRVLTDKICSNLYKKYKRETGLELWKLPEAHLLINSKPENKVSSFPEQCEEEGPITFEAKPNPELIIKSVLDCRAHYALFGMENMGIMDYMANGSA